MATAVFIPYPETSHLNAGFKLAKTLKSRGHRVIYLTLFDYESRLRSQGLELIPFFQELFAKGFIDQEAVRNNMEAFDAILLRAEKSGQAFRPEQEIQEIIRIVRPDVFIVDLLLPELASIIDQSGIPVVLLNTLLHDPWREMRVAYEPLSKLPELILCPQEFDFPGVERRKNTYYVEASIDLTRDDIPFPWHRVDREKPLIYCSLGTQNHLYREKKEFFRVVIEALALRPDRQLILSIGSSLKIEEFHPVSSNILIVNAAPQLEALSRASILISHGGINSVKESIFFGVPMILFPVTRDQPAIASRVVYHGLGAREKIQKASIELIHSLIDRIDREPSFRSRAESMSRTFREREESAMGVQFVEAILRREK